MDEVSRVGIKPRLWSGLLPESRPGHFYLPRSDRNPLRRCSLLTMDSRSRRDAVAIPYSHNEKHCGTQSRAAMTMSQALGARIAPSPRYAPRWCR
jgi:hypothetical protein